MWYWYFTGMGTIILFLSIVANLGFAQGWIRYEKRNPKTYTKSRVTLYDWSDDSGPISRAS